MREVMDGIRAAVCDFGRWRNPQTGGRAGEAAARQRAQGLFDPDRGPSPVPGTVLLAAGVDPAQPSSSAPAVPQPVSDELRADREREHEIGLPEPAAPSCPGHERVIRELKNEVRRLSAENWRLSQAQEKRNPDGSTTDAGDAGGSSDTPDAPAVG